MMEWIAEGSEIPGVSGEDALRIGVLHIWSRVQHSRGRLKIALVDFVELREQLLRMSFAIGTFAALGRWTQQGRALPWDAALQVLRFATP